MRLKIFASPFRFAFFQSLGLGFIVPTQAAQRRFQRIALCNCHNESMPRLTQFLVLFLRFAPQLSYVSQKYKYLVPSIGHSRMETLSSSLSVVLFIRTRDQTAKIKMPVVLRVCHGKGSHETRNLFSFFGRT